MAQLRLLLCTPSPSALSLSKNPPSPLLFIDSTLPSRNSSISLSSLQPSLRSLPCFSLLRRPLISASAVVVHAEQTSTEPESEIEELSRTRVLAQNVPWSSTAGDIRALFEKHGTVVDVELSMHNRKRNRGLAFVEMGSPEEASEALSKLEAYEFEGRILKLNYAKPRTKKPSPSMQSNRLLTFELFVGNLSYEVSAEDLTEFFTSEGYNGVSARVVLKGDPKKSAGYGFVAFATKEEANAALSGCEGKELLGRAIQLERCIRFKRGVKSESEDVASESKPIVDVDQVEESKDL